MMKIIGKGTTQQPSIVKLAAKKNISMLLSLTQNT